MAVVSPFKFIQEVRTEMSKVTWPTRREVFVSSVMVLIFTAIAAAFFSLVNYLINVGLTGLLSYFGT